MEIIDSKYLKNTKGSGLRLWHHLEAVARRGEYERKRAAEERIVSKMKKMLRAINLEGKAKESEQSTM